MDYDTIYDYLIDNDIATSEEIDLVTYINGNNVTSLLDILYVRTGFTSWIQLEDEEDGSDEESLLYDIIHGNER